MFSSDDCGVFEFHARVEKGFGTFAKSKKDLLYRYMCAMVEQYLIDLYHPNGFRSNWMVHMNVDKEWLRIRGALGIILGQGTSPEFGSEMVNFGNELCDVALAGENKCWFVKFF